MGLREVTTRDGLDIDLTPLNRTHFDYADIPLTEQELFLLLGRMDGRELLTELRHKTKLKLVIHGPPPGSLHARGVSEGIESLKQEWEEVQRVGQRTFIPDICHLRINHRWCCAG